MFPSRQSGVRASAYPTRIGRRRSSEALPRTTSPIRQMYSMSNGLSASTPPSLSVCFTSSAARRTGRIGSGTSWAATGRPV